MNPTDVVTLDGGSLSLADLERAARNPNVRVVAEEGARRRVENCRRLIEVLVKRYEDSLADPGSGIPHVYGVTTGFGEFKDVGIPPADLLALQKNILLSHLVGVGDSSSPDDLANYFPPEVVRAVLVLRLNTFLKGHSGVRMDLVDILLSMLSEGVVPLVPIKGSVGSSGDLCPLAHLFAVLVGAGRFYCVRSTEEMSAGNSRSLFPAEQIWETLGLRSLALSYKEGLALTNGATFSAAMLALAVQDATRLANTADVAAAMTLEAICGRTRALDDRVHQVRNMLGQAASAGNLRRLITGSRLVEKSHQVQDAYSVRCAPQVHGASRDAIAYARRIAEAEANAATDNPLFFPDSNSDSFDARFHENFEGPPRDTHAFSAGNFHGQPVALAADFLAVAVAELANIAERRIQMLLDRHHNRNLPANLIPRPGLNSGFMLAQYCAASLVAENKVLAHPASVDSIPTSANTEDHVSMATLAARKLRTIVGNCQAVLAIELLAATQALDWRLTLRQDPNASEAGLPTDDEARTLFHEATRPDRRGSAAASLGLGTRAAYLKIREVAVPMTEDRPLDTDIRSVRQILFDGSFIEAVTNGLASAGVHVSDGLAEIASL